MKKTYLLAVICLSVIQVKAQQAFLFKIKYLPNHFYASNITMNMNMEMNVSGDEDVMEKIKEKGLELPMVLVSTSTMSTNIRTGAIKSEDTFPLTMSFTDLTKKNTLNGKETASSPNPLIGQTIYGECTTSGNIHIDSISGKTMDESLKATLTATISNMVNQLHFPEKPLNIGDSFIQEVPFNLPVSDINMQFVIKINYKLVAVQNNSAYFDLVESMTMDVSSQKDAITLTGKGTGDGKLVYNIDQNFPTSMNSNLDFDYQILVKGMTITGKAKTSSRHDTIISVVDK